MSRRVLVLTSGGLDSLLAMKIMEKSGLDVIGIHFVTWFNIPKYTLLEDYSKRTNFYKGFQIHSIDVSEEYTNILLSPIHGYGSAANPCIDCKILFFRKAGALLQSFGADFVATGEVIGQRPMTQKRNVMKMIEKKSGLAGYLLRPLSAKLLDQTIPEERGWISRDDLFDISGRGRKRQMELASLFGIDEYPSPAGGCILTEKQFKVRFTDLVNHTLNIHVEDLMILRYGRHFRLSDECKLVIGKHEKENEILRRIKWGNVSIDPLSVPGPYSKMVWPGTLSLLRSALKLVVRYSDFKEADRRISFEIKYNGGKKIFSCRLKPDFGLSIDTIIH